MRPDEVCFVISAIVVWSLFFPSEAHVALTFPPARKYDLDFLDNSRTKAPCGMPKDNIKTSLLAGSKFNVTWHLGYPHKGGFKIQLLDHLERPVLDLTPTIQGSEFVSNDATAQSYHVQLPPDYTCKDCTLRLIRQALEWGNTYKFWSCADVDIKPRKEYRETCSGHGRYLLSRCKCDRLYYGDRCQYRDECWENSDCGDHGKCVDVEATTAPKQQCYCELGWFGPGCNKRSPARNTEIDFDLYTMRKLSDTFRLYWRILKEHKELEVVMVVNGTGYVGLGWRPRSLTSSCKNFPLIGPLFNETAVNEPVNEPEPKADEQQHAEPEPATEPAAEPSPTPEPKSEPSSTAEPAPDPKSEPVAEPAPSPELTEPEPPTTLKPKYKKSLYSRRSASPSPRVRTAREHAGDIVETSVSFKVSTKQGRQKREVEEVLEPDVNAESQSEPVAEPTSEPEPVSEPTSEPAAEPKPTAEPEPEPTTKERSNAEAPKPTKTKPDKPLNPYTPRHDFNPMDCADMIIGSARNTSSRIADYYTRDRSTPRMDNFWGGKNDLTAAMGFEKDGVTTILFRRKLEAKEESDHSIEQDLMHVVWAQGQENGKYIHVPKSGIETASASVKDFYRPDELKYHGHGMQRGVTTINFFEEKQATVVVDTVNSEEEAPCSGGWRHPRNCNPDNHTCEYSAQWEYLPKGDEVRFVISTKHTDVWTGIAFSNDEKMSQTDAILGWVDKTGRPFLMDTWITGYTQPLLDASQGIFNTSGRIIDGSTVLSFTRKRLSDDARDLSFTSDKCLFFMYPVRGGAFNSVNKKIRKHEVVPTISTNRVCIKLCDNDILNSIAATSTEPPSLGYNMEVKIVNLGENFHPPEPGSIQYEELSNTINSNFKSLFNKVLGFRQLTVQDIKGENNNIIASVNLRVDKMVSEKGRALSETDQQEEAVKALFQNSVESGTVGALKVDPGYYVFESESLTSDVAGSSEEESFFSLSGTKLYIVLGCLAALVLLALLQASCTIYRTTKKLSSNHKDHLLQNSAWKDYSSANTNYAFDTFENDEKPNNGYSETLPAKSYHRGPRPQGPPPSVPHYVQSLGDTRSLQRPREAPFPSGHLERNTLSLPRTTNDRRRPPQDVQPDFYFMPSQRKYSGEVVRVYVDYNNKK